MRVFQALSVYVLALGAALFFSGCGGFEALNAEDSDFPFLSTNGTGVSSQTIRLIQVTSLGIDDDGARTINFKISDGTSTTAIQLFQDGMTRKSFTSARVGNKTLNIASQCNDNECFTLTALLTETDTLTNKRSQAAYLIELKILPPQYQATYEILGGLESTTIYTDPQQAFPALRNQFMNK